MGKPVFVGTSGLTLSSLTHRMGWCAIPEFTVEIRNSVKLQGVKRTQVLNESTEERGEGGGGGRRRESKSVHMCKPVRAGMVGSQGGDVKAGERVPTPQRP